MEKLTQVRLGAKLDRELDAILDRSRNPFAPSKAQFIRAAVEAYIPTGRRATDAIKPAEPRQVPLTLRDNGRDKAASKQSRGRQKR